MTKTLAFILSASLAACAAGEAEVRYSSNAATPELIAMDTNPNVMVVSNADEPTFYADNTYWLFRNDRWYRSSSHRNGWKAVDSPPETIRGIQQPTAYVHFRGGASRTTMNQSGQPVQQTPEFAEPQRAGDPALPSDTSRSLNPQGTPAQPYPNPLPPQQVPPNSNRDPQIPGNERTPQRAPSPDTGPMLRDPASPDRAPLPSQSQQVPPAASNKPASPDNQVTPDPDRAPTTPGMTNRSNDQRPATSPTPTTPR